MATFKLTDEAEIAATITNSQGHPPLQPPTGNSVQLGPSSPVLDTSDTTIPKPNGLSTSGSSVDVPSSRTTISEQPLKVPTVIIDNKNQLQDATTGPKHEGPPENTTQYYPHQQTPQNLVVPSLEDIPSVVQGTDDTVTTSGTTLHDNVLIPEACASSQPAPPVVTEEPHVTGTSVPSGEKGLLKDIFLEFSAPHHFNNELVLGIMRSSGAFENLHLTRISATKWKALGDIEFHRDDGYMTLIVHSKNGGDEAFLILAADEIYAMACAEEDIVGERAFASVKEDITMSTKILFTIAPSSHFVLHDMNAAALAQRAISDLRREQEFIRRLEDTGNVEDITRAIGRLERTVSSVTPFDDIVGTTSGLLGDLYIRRFKCTANVQDIDRAISHHQKAVESTPSGHADLPSCFNNLGNSYLRRFERTGDLKDIDSAMSHHQKAVESTPSSHADLPSRFNNLGSSYLRRFERTGDLKDVDSAISHRQKAVESTPSGHADLPSRFNNLGNSYLRRFERTGDFKDVDSAISHHQKAVESTPSGHADLPSLFANLGSSYSCRFERTGDLKDVDSAIFHHQKAVESTPSGHADLPRMFNNLGSSYLGRFERTGDLKDIDSAISNHQKAVESTPSGHADLPSWFANLGGSYLGRFERTGDLKDVDSATSHHQKAVESTPSGHADLPSRFNNLGNSYLRRFERTGDLKDIDSAISHHQKAVESTPSGHADLPRWFANLGSSYSRRFEHTEDLKDVDSAISHHQKAVESTPSGHADLPRMFNNLGSSYLGSFERTGDLKDIDSAISHHQKAVESTPSGHVGLPMMFKNLGTSYLHRFERNRYYPDIQYSITSYRRGAEANGTPSIRLASAKRAAMLSSVHDRSQCLIDFSLSISLLSEVAGLEQTIHRRHANLLDHSDFIGSAVATALHLGRPDLALQWLEQGRCLVWNQINQLRNPVDNLRMKSFSLADRFIKVANALESHGSRSILSIPSSQETLGEDIRLQDDTLNHTLLADEYRQLLEDIRNLPGFDDFLRPPKVITLLSSLPSDGPVIIFNIHETQCDALALIAGIEEPLHIPLDNFSLAKAGELQKNLQVDLLKQREIENQDRMPQRVQPYQTSVSLVLKELWCKVVQPILEALGYSSLLNPSDRRRIWWCPTGPLAFLPLHAAGTYGSSYKPGLRISDFVVSSYTPTVQSLNQKALAPTGVPKCTNLLLISPNTPNLHPIPFTRNEIHDLKALVDKLHIHALLLEDGAATTDKVKREMNACSWVHFACHGIQDAEDPLKSGVHLHDGRLELLEIMRQNISNPELAFLSACQTSKGDLKLSEEVVHLAAGMLAAGYRGVVGTMWSISDRHGPEFARWFYQYLLEEMGTDGLESTRAAYALDYATKKVRETLGESDTAFLTWVPYVHFGY